MSTLTQLHVQPLAALTHASPAAMDAFVQHLEESYAEENVLFWRLVRKYQAIDDLPGNKTNPQHLRVASELWRRFLSPDGEHHMRDGIAESTRAALREAVERGQVDSTTFDRVLEEVIDSLVAGSFARFEASPEFEAVGLPSLQFVSERHLAGLDAAAAQAKKQQQQQQQQQGDGSGVASLKGGSGVSVAAIEALLLKAGKELYETEKTYVHGLEVLMRAYKWFNAVHELQQPQILTPKEVQSILTNLTDIYELNKKICSELETHYLHGTLLTEASSIFRTYTPFLKVYTMYVNNFERARAVLSEAQERTSVANYLAVFEKVEGLDFSSFLIMPVQRVPRYLLLLESLLKHARKFQEQHPSYDSQRLIYAAEALDGQGQPMLLNIDLQALETCLLELKTVAKGINKTVGNWEAQIKVVELQKMFDSKVQLVRPGRYWIRDGALKKVYNKRGFHHKMHKKYWFFLFSDCLVYAARPNQLRQRYDYKHSLPLGEMTITDLPDTDKLKNAFYIETKTTKSFAVYAPTPENKYEWMADILNAIEKIKANSNTLVRSPSTEASLTRLVSAASSDEDEDEDGDD